jgi:hypothetical protein
MYCEGEGMLRYIPEVISVCTRFIYALSVCLARCQLG